MIPMRLREMTSCVEHKRSIIVLEATESGQTLAIAVDPEESHRLFRELSRSKESEHPIFDFVDGLLGALQLTPARAMLELMPGVGLRGEVTFDGPDGALTVPCYPSDAIALALRAHTPIYVSASAFSDDQLSLGPPANEPAEVRHWLNHVRPGDFSARAWGDRTA